MQDLRAQARDLAALRVASAPLQRLPTPKAAESERSMTAPQLPLNVPELPPELDFCAKCRDHTTFEWDELEGWLSVCCGARSSCSIG